ncbi:MAG TPA: D-alanyl-D-alanine carboxypeptidase [Cyclobacteriaceae bacterium]|nr:D-alanyl-D-alanine carboxypeptidase [Cyclobacteriaceae bacterium]
MRYAVVGFFLLTCCSPGNFIKKEIVRGENALQQHVGFYLADLSTDKVLIDHHGAKYFTPASNTKIFTLYTCLRLLGDSVSSLKYFQSGDSLIFQGLGDPSFLYKPVFDNGRVYKFLKGQPARLFFSGQNFKTESLGPGWAWDDYNYDYSAERSPFPLFGNLISVVHPNDSSFQFAPQRFSSDFHLSPEVHTDEEIIRGIDSNELTHFNGKRKSTSFIIPFRTSSDLTTDLLSDTLHRSVEEIDKPMLPRGLILKSIPSDSLYKVMMQESDNFIAEQLLLQCAAVVSDSLKPEIAIRYSTKNLLADLPDAPTWVDGSGLSRFNLFTPRSIVALWKKIYAAVPQDRLFQLIAVGGKNGTLKNWLKAEPPYIFGKTGSLSNNRTLSGFLVTRKNKILVFSFMNNNFTVPSAEVRKEMEKVLRLVRDKF